MYLFSQYEVLKQLTPSWGYNFNLSYQMGIAVLK